MNQIQKQMADKIVDFVTTKTGVDVRQSSRKLAIVRPRACAIHAMVAQNIPTQLVANYFKITGGAVHRSLGQLLVKEDIALIEELSDVFPRIALPEEIPWQSIRSW